MIRIRLIPSKPARCLRPRHEGGVSEPPPHRPQRQLVFGLVVEVRHQLDAVIADFKDIAALSQHDVIARRGARAGQSVPQCHVSPTDIAPQLKGAAKDR